MTESYHNNILRRKTIFFFFLRMTEPDVIVYCGSEIILSYFGGQVTYPVKESDGSNTKKSNITNKIALGPTTRMRILIDGLFFL